MTGAYIPTFELEGKRLELLSELVPASAPIAVLINPQGEQAEVALTAKQATATIPIIFNTGDDPMRLGLVDSINRPGGNVTGVVIFTQGLEAKRLGLLHEMVPKAAPIAALINPNFVSAEIQMRDLTEAAARLSLQLVFVRANAESEIDAAFATLVQQRAGALLVCASPFFLIVGHSLA